ncbi:hypothetical protein BZG36_03716 [Bifiguratus adelaidae]|uniref:Carbonic anhydrase n=1 Tax=Bifiguratus adelaidae TaxID=1938954 RepID=A0A261XZ22_9FUNG|nr:hypothetical protein BZG36_03716 [Bifiguratus adelaidae]
MNNPLVSKKVEGKFVAESGDRPMESILRNNREWAKSVKSRYPDFFEQIAKSQQPKILWIGCSDSRVPAEQITQLGPGELFVARNIANVVNNTDLSVLSVLQYAVEVLKVEHVVICGHYNCGGVAAACGHGQFGLIDNWLRCIKDVYQTNASELDKLANDQKIRRLVELNVLNSVKNVANTTIVQNAWAKEQSVTVHGWVYDLSTGMIKDLEASQANVGCVSKIFKYNH